MKKFSDFCEDKILDGDKVKIDLMLDKELIIHDFKVNNSKYSDGSECMTLQISEDGENKKVLFTGSEVLIEQLKKYKYELPFKAKIKKINKYYTLI